MAGSGKSRWVAEVAPSGGTPGPHTHPEGDLPDATTTAQGVVELATSAETITGTDTTRAVTPAAGAAAYHPLDTVPVLHRSTAETVTGTKTLDTPLVNTQVSTPSSPPAGKNTGPYWKINGLPYYLTPGGEEVQFSVGDVLTALHGNSDFEAQTAGVPDVWGSFWQTNGALTSSGSSAHVFAGSLAALVTLSAAGFQVLQSDVFSVSPGDVIDFSIMAKKLTGSPTIRLEMLTKASGTPDYFDAPTTPQYGATVTLPTTHTKFTQTFTVPSGHTVARLGYRIDAPAAATAALDYSGSRKTVATVPDLDWVKRRVVAAGTGNINLASPGTTIDGVTMALNDRFLAPAQTTGSACGIYVWNGSAVAATRATDAASAADIAGVEVSVSKGTLHGGTLWATTFKASDTLGTTAMVWYPMRPVAGTSTVVLTAVSQAFNTITFPVAFPTAPSVQVTTENASYFGATAVVTTTGCRVYAVHRDGTNATVNVVAHWTATPIV